ncbi:MAG: NAD(P)/FAD-dependent oxidoreductase [bacterium]
MKIVIIGNGVAAVSAVEAIREIDKNCEITIISKENEPFYTPCFLANYLSGEIAKDRLYLKNERFYDEQRVKTIFGNAVAEIKVEERSIRLSDGRELFYDTLLIAAGSNPIMPKLPNIEGGGVFSFKTMSDADRIISNLKKINSAVIVGAGFIGLEVAEAFIKKGINATVIERDSRVLPRMLDSETAEFVTSHMKKNGVKIMTEKEVKAICRRGGNITGVETKEEIIPCELVVIAVGVAPNLEMIRGNSIKVDKGVIVDDDMRTNIPDIYAAGDIAEMEIQGERKINPIWFYAAKGGRIAGLNMMGLKKRYAAPFTDMNVVTLFGLPVFSAGIQRGSKTLKHQDSKGIKKIYLDENECINGVQLIKDVAKGGLYLSLINKRVPYSLAGGQ